MTIRDEITTVICARNAAATIERAVASAVEHGRTLLVDDWSTDATADLSRRAGGVRLTIVRPPEHRTLGYARGFGLAHVETPWVMWLDADDELLSGRGGRLLRRALDDDLDGVWDAVALHDGRSGEFIRNLPMPPFMLEPGAAVRLFDRNWIPGPAWPLLRTGFAREIGYDARLPTADDLDFVLRAYLSGGRLGFVDEVGYRQFAYADSLSRDLSHQRKWTAAVLARHPYAEVARRYRESSLSRPVALWALVNMALFRREPVEALAFLDEIDVVAPLSDKNFDAVLEPHGPWSLPEDWRRDFQRGTINLMLGDNEGALVHLDIAESRIVTPEGANNLGIALFRCGLPAAARERFSEALARFPAYLDAHLNLAAEVPEYITTHPLRIVPSRSEYTPPAIHRDTAGK